MAYAFVNKTTGWWDVRYDLPRNPDDIDAKTGKPRRNKTTKRNAGKTKAAALKWHAVNVVAKLDNGTFVDRTDVTFGQVADRWWRAHKLLLKPSTRPGYEVVLYKHLVPDLGNTKLRDMTPGTFTSLYARKAENGHRQRKGRGLSASYQRRIHAVARMVCQFAVDEGLLASNPAAKAKILSKKKTERQSRASRTFYGPEQVKTLIDATTDHRHGVMIRFVFMTGCRRAEVCGARWGDVDLDAGTFTVRQTIVAPRYEMQITSPKSEDGERTIALDDETKAALKAHKVRQNEERLAFGPGWGTHPLADDLIFRDEEGGPVKPALFSLAFQTAVAKAGLPKIRLHDARHTHAALLALSGASPQEMSERLGHHSAAFTLSNYGGLYKDRDKRAAAGVAALVAEGGKA
jgi:integrase